MPQFQYSAVTADGNVTHGNMFANSSADAVSMLSHRGFVPTHLAPSKAWFPRLHRVSLQHQVTWYSMLSDLLASGMPLTQSLELIVEQTNAPVLKQATRDLRNRVTQGESLSNAMKHHAGIFDSMSRYLVSAGEEGNFLGTALERIANIKEAKSKLLSKVSAALAYPLFLLCVGGLVLSGMMLMFVPKFEPLFERMRQTQGLPWATELLFAIHHFVSRHLAWIMGSLGGSAVLLARLFASPRLLKWRDRFLMSNRYVGPLYSGFVISQFCQVLGSLIASGIRVQEATLIAGQASGNTAVESASHGAVEKITEGLGLADAMATQNILPRSCVEMIRVGERSNRLEKVLQSMATRLEARNEQRLNMALRLLEPGLMLVMAGLIGFVMIALLMPIFNASGKSF